MVDATLYSENGDKLVPFFFGNKANYPIDPKNNFRIKSFINN